MEPRSRAVLAALKSYGTPYRWGGNEPHDYGVDHYGKRWTGVVDISTGERIDAHGILGGMDCSGAVLFWWRSAGLNLRDMSAATLYANLPHTTTPKPGDLAFYGQPGSITHVVMALTNGATVVIGANGGSRPKASESLTQYAGRMASVGAMVKVEDAGFAYRSDFRGFRACPLAE